jgi:anti-sigma B factor antagonist
MIITESETNGFCVLYVEGRVDTIHVPEFERQIFGRIDRGETNLLINCKGLTYISSFGLRVFLMAQKKVLAKKGRLYLCELTRHVLETISISGFSSIFMIFETEEEALEKKAT